jgi:hypothetical protein
MNPKVRKTLSGGKQGNTAESERGRSQRVRLVGGKRRPLSSNADKAMDFLPLLPARSHKKKMRK